MPKLTHKAAHEFWHRYPDPMIYRAICFMESVEDWTIDNEPGIEQALQRLGNALENIDDLDLAQEEKLIEICAYIKSARWLQLLMTLDTAQQGSAAKVLIKAEQTSNGSTNDTPGYFLQRNVVFERLRLLGRIFSKDRCQLLQKALEESGYES